MVTETQIPITLLSGFLGAGKTTLLKNILTDKDHNLRCAVIVNDMASLNIDAQYIDRQSVIQREEKLVRMQNGCVCCTLRGDLLEEIYNLSKHGAYDYIVIESTGISEPMQVAETFTTEFLEEELEAFEDDLKVKMTELLKDGGIQKFAKLDTLVTVVDACNFFTTFETVALVEGDDERTISNLMVDQIEFANIILLNKVEMVSKAQLVEVEQLLKVLNPKAQVILTNYCKVDLKLILNTELFDFEQAATSAGWLQSLHEMTTQKNGKVGPKPETEEYGISSFVYSRRMPFHPAKLFSLVNDKFFVIQELGEDGDEDDEMSEEDEDQQNYKSLKESDDEEEEDQKRVIAKKSSCFGSVLRSKGLFWLATDMVIQGEWSQAGCILTLNHTSNWLCTENESQWSKDEVEFFKADFDKWGDRRQEIVFIGTDIGQKKIEQSLDSCLLTEKEFELWETVAVQEDDIEEKENKLRQYFSDPYENYQQN